MAYSPTNDFNLEVARGNIANIGSLRKYGRATNCDNGDPTDIHDGANTSDDVAIWVAPTQARIHAIVSTSANDDTAGTGAKLVKIYGLTSWSTAEVSEDVITNGTTPVNTSNSYVIIHRMKVTSFGSAGPNVGVITATAATDATVTAQINAAEGQTQMAVYGIPDGVDFYMMKYYGSVEKAAASFGATVSLLVNPIPDSEETGFVVKHTVGLVSEGTSYLDHCFPIPNKIEGPAIIKLQVNSSADNTEANGGFDGYLVTES